MQRRSAKKPAAGGGERPDRPVRRGSEYDAFYQVLDLPPGAPLAAIEDAARLLRAAFQPDGLPVSLKQQAQARAQAVSRALGELRHFWRTHHKAPPSADLGGAAGLLDALVEALGESGAATANARGDGAAGRTLPSFADRADGRHQPLPVASSTNANAVVRLPAVRRLHRIELAAVLHGNQVFEVVDRPARPMLPVPSRPVPLAAASPMPGPVRPAPPALADAGESQRRAFSDMRGIAMKLGAVGLAIAFAALLQHYAIDFLSPAAAVRAAPHSAAGAPAAAHRPVRQ